MNLISNFLLLATLAVPAVAQSNSEPRTAGPIPVQSSVKVDAPPKVASEEAPSRPTNLDRQVPSIPPQKPIAGGVGRTRVPALQLDQLYYTTQQDGSTWASGRTYKARFGPGGATYIPFLGSQAPRNFPLELSLASASVNGVEIPLAPATSAVRDGDRIVIDRGPIDEVYELGLDSVEQTFVVAERPASGDLRFIVRLESEMARSEDSDGFTYSNELGSVHYGRAFVREADGRRVPVASQMAEGGIEIVIGREYLAHAPFPLVVDPVITTFAVSTTTEDTWESDVAYDLTTDRYLVVYERSNSLSDGDILAQLRDANGNGIGFTYLDNTGENWRSPQCANMNSANQFLMVAQASAILGAPDWNIWGITVDAATMGAGWKTLISTTDQAGPKYLPDVGGDPYELPGTSYYCVTWRRDLGPTDWDIHARLVTPQSTLVGGGTMLIDNSGGTRDSWPSISKSNGTLGAAALWTVAWHREVTSTDYDVYMARVGWNGMMVTPSTAIATAGGYQYYPRASSPLNDTRSLVIYGRRFGLNDDDIEGALINGSGATFVSLTQLEPANTILQNQIEYSIDSDGERFVVAFAENLGASTVDYDTWISSFAPFGGGLVATEAHVSLEYTSAQSLRTDVVARRSGGAVGSTRFYASWDSTGNGGHDLRGALYDAPIGGAVQFICPGDGTVVACPCGNNGWTQRGCGNSLQASGALLLATGNAQTGAGDNMTFTVSSVPAGVTCTLFQGTSAHSGAVFGDGIRCISGSQRRIRTKPASASGSAVWPSGSEPTVSMGGAVPAGGGERFYQVIYRNSADFCSPATFNLSNGIRAFWVP